MIKKKKKKQEFFDSFNISEAKQKYKKYCGGECNEFNYLGWKKQVVEKLKDFDCDMLENLRHCILNKKDSIPNFNNPFVSIMIVTLSFILSVFGNLTSLNDDSAIKNIGFAFNIFSSILIILYIVIIICSQIKENNLEFSFYRDLLEITKEIKNGKLTDSQMMNEDNKSNVQDAETENSEETIKADNTSVTEIKENKTQEKKQINGKRKKK